MSLVFDFFHSSSSSESEEEEELSVSMKGANIFRKAMSWGERKRSDDNCVISTERQTHTDGFKGICKSGDKIYTIQSHPKVGYGIVMLDKNRLMKSKRIHASECKSDTSLNNMKQKKREPKGLVVVNDNLTYFTCMQKKSKLHILQCMIREKGSRKLVAQTVPWPEKYAKAKSSPRYLCYHENSGYVYMICGNGMVFRMRVQSNSIELFGHTGHGGARNLCFGVGTSSNFLIVTGKNYVAVFDILRSAKPLQKPMYFQFFQKTSLENRLFRSKPFQNDFWFEKAGNKFRKVCMIDGTMIVLHSYGICVVQYDFIKMSRTKDDGHITYNFQKANCADHRIFANLSGMDPHDLIPIRINRDEHTATLAVTVTGNNEIHVMDVDFFGNTS